MKRAATSALCLTMGSILIQPARAGVTNLDTVRVAAGLTRPVYVTAPRGDTARLFIIEQRVGSIGQIRILQLPGNTLVGTPYLSVSPVATGNEEGLLGLAFHPDFMNNGYFWIYYTNSSGNNVVVRYQANAPFATSTTANAATATPVLTLSHPVNTNHNGGWMGFGPDGYLYIATGDGGSGNDPPNNAQNINALLGKMLRLDVDGADNIPGNADDDAFPGDATRLYENPPSNPFFGPTAGLDEIWSMGLRNPWRNSFDRETGDLYIGDVGQNAVEEIDFQEGGMASTPIRNYGWRCMEGTSCTGLTGCTCNAPALTLPIHTFTHAAGNCSVTGGYVYRGCRMPDMHGIYFFADYCSAQIWSFRYSTGSGVTEFINRTAELAPGGGLGIATITSFGEDDLGEIYICDQAGEVFKIIPAAPAPPALGACCQEGACGMSLQTECEAGGGVFMGECVSCADIECPTPQACCFEDGSCVDTDVTTCQNAGGTPAGEGVACANDPCEPAVPAATMVSAVSRQSCDINLLPELKSDSRQPGILRVVLGFDVRINPGPFAVSAGGPGGVGVQIEESSCTAPAYVPYTGDLTGATADSLGSSLIIDVPALTNARTYRLHLGSDITTIPNQEIELRGLVGDANSDGFVNAVDRSLVVGAWTGPGVSCETDVNVDGATNAVDRSVVVGAWTSPAGGCAP